MASIQAEVKKERELNALKAAQEAKLAALKAPKEPKAPKVHKTKFRRLSPSTKLIYILSIGLIISLMFSYMYVSSPKGVYGIQLWLGNLAFWTKDPTKLEGGILGANIGAVISLFTFYGTLILGGLYAYIMLPKASEVEDTLYNLMGKHVNEVNMHELAIKEFKETELYLGLASNRFRKKIIDKGLYNEVDRLKELWYSPIKNYVPEACIEPVEPVIEENNTVEEPE